MRAKHPELAPFYDHATQSDVRRAVFLKFFSVDYLARTGTTGDEWNRLKKGFGTAATGFATFMVEHGRRREAEEMWKAVNSMRAHIVQSTRSTEAERKLDGLLSPAYETLYVQDELVVLSLHNAVKECSTSLPAVSDTRATDRCFESSHLSVDPGDWDN